MDDIGWTGVHLDVLADLGALRLVWLLDWIPLPALILSSEEPDHRVIDHLHDKWEEGVDEHRLDEGVAGHLIPTRDVIRVVAVEDASSERERFGEVSLDEEQDQGGVEELSKEDTVGDLGQHLRVGVVPDPGDETDGQRGQQGVDNDDEDGDSISDAKGKVGVETVS